MAHRDVRHSELLSLVRHFGVELPPDLGLLFCADVAESLHRPRVEPWLHDHSGLPVVARNFASASVKAAGQLSMKGVLPNSSGSFA